MKVKAKIQLNFKNNKQAKLTYDTLEVDNENFLDSNLKNNTITYEINNNSLTTTVATIDDLRACEILSEKILTKTNYI